MSIDCKSIGMRIKHYRAEKHMSQEELALAIHTSSIYISYIETGSRTPSLETLLSTANALDVSADDLLTDNLKHSTSPVSTEIHDLLLDCNHDEKVILTRTLKFLKALLSELGV